MVSGARDNCGIRVHTFRWVRGDQFRIRFKELFFVSWVFFRSFFAFLCRPGVLFAIPFFIVKDKLYKFLEIVWWDVLLFGYFFFSCCSLGFYILFSKGHWNYWAQ